MAETIRMKVEADTADAEKNVDNLGESINETGDATSQLTEKLDAMTGGLISGFKNAVTGLKSAVMGFKSLRVAIAATGIGALLVAFGSLVSFFTKTERGAQALRVITASLEAAMGALTDVLVQVGEAIFSAFQDPQKALKDFYSSLKTFVIDAVDNVISGFSLLGKAIKQVFERDFTGALETAKEATIQLADGLTDLNPATAVIKRLAVGAKELGDEVARDVKEAANLERELNKLKVSERELRVERAEANAEIERAKLIAEDLTKSFDERREAAKRALTLERSFVEQELKNARDRLRIQQRQNELNESDEEALEREAELKIAVANLEQQSLTKQIELNNKLNALEKERIANLMAIREESGTIERIAVQRLETIPVLQEGERQLAGTKMEVAAQEKQSIKTIDILRNESAIAAVNVANQALGNLALLFEDNARAQKAISIAEATITTFQGAASAFAAAQAIPPPFGQIIGTANAAAAVAAGFAQIRKIKNTRINRNNSDGGGVPSAGGGGGSAFSSFNQANTPTISSIPTFNNSPIPTGGQSGEPIRAFVVENDITTAQNSQKALERRAIL